MDLRERAGFGDTSGVVIRKLHALVLESSMGFLGWALISCGGAARGPETAGQLRTTGDSAASLNAPAGARHNSEKSPPEWTFCPLAPGTGAKVAEPARNDQGECKQHATSEATFTPCAGGPPAHAEIERCCRPLSGDADSYEASCTNALRVSSSSGNSSVLALASETIRGNRSEGDFDYYQDELQPFELGAGVQALARYYRHQQVGGLEETTLTLFAYDGTTLRPILERTISSTRGETLELAEKLELVPRAGHLPELVVARRELDDRGELRDSRVVLRFENGQYRVVSR